MEVVQVQPRDSYLYNIYVPTQGTVIRWSFTTKRNNISFGLFRRREKEPLPNSSDIIFRAQQQPLQKRQMSLASIDIPQAGNFYCCCYGLQLLSLCKMQYRLMMILNPLIFNIKTIIIQLDHDPNRLLPSN